MNKIFEINNLISRIRLEKRKNKKIVHCHGVFDLIHVGHIKHFKEAKKNGNFLVVSITSDKFVNKGSGRPIFNPSIAFAGSPHTSFHSPSANRALDKGRGPMGYGDSSKTTGEALMATAKVAVAINFILVLFE